MPSLSRAAALLIALAPVSALAAAPFGPLLSRIEGASPADVVRLNRGGLVSLKLKGGAVFAHVFVEGDATAAGAVLSLGGVVHSVLPNGILTAEVPVRALRALAARADVTGVEAGKRMRLYNELSNGFSEVTSEPSGTYGVGMNNPRTSGGAGVIVGVIDSGLDWTHGDFIDDLTGASRILYYWDQSDVADDRLPTGTGWSFAYGHEYTAADFDAALGSYDHTWNQATNHFAPYDLGYPIKAAARDTDGHGTHVTGTAAGDGSASGQEGVAPLADIIFVKFDFDGDRNTDTAIIDGVNYIFKRAKELGRPAVINMSLGSDFGPHDGSTLEERGIDELTGSGKVVVVAAGNPGANNWSAPLAWGFAIHGQGNMGTDPIALRIPAGGSAGANDTYGFFDVWYESTDTCRVRVTTPSGQVYPPSFSGAYRTLWTTNSGFKGFNTSEGSIYVQNGNEPLGYGSSSLDRELYVEISDAGGAEPAAGTWKIELVPTNAPNGSYHAWFGASGDLVQGWRAEAQPRAATPTFGGAEPDNRVTIGSPASANHVIAVAAYQTRNAWPYYDPVLDAQAAGMQAYGQAPITYYDGYGLGELAYFSGRGPRRDGVLKPEIATPGVGIVSSFSHFTRHEEWPARATPYSAGGPYHFGLHRVSPNLEATTLQGTSMATPNATGAIALLLEAAPSLSDVDLRALFADTARHDGGTDTFWAAPQSAGTDTDLFGTGSGLPNNDWGYGKLDLAASLAQLAVDNPPSASIVSPSEGATVSGTVNVRISAGDDRGVASVQLSVSGGAFASVTAFDGSAYTYSWNTTGLTGSQTLVARVTDSGGNTTLSATRTVKVGTKSKRR